MLKSWSIDNFKSIVHSGELKLAPVTVLAGLNSSGKSSLLQSILMISQTLANGVLDRPLVLNGPILRLGTFENILYDASQPLTLSFEWAEEEEKKEGEFILFSPASARVTATFSIAAGSGKGSPPIEAPKAVLGKTLLEFALSEEFAPDKQYAMSIARVSDIEFQEFLKDLDSEHLDAFASQQDKYLGKIQSAEDTTESSFLATLAHFLPASATSPSQKSNPSGNIWRDLAGIFSGPLGDFFYRQIFRELSQAITRFFTTRVRYLGPLRADPQAIQGFASSDELDDVGTKGEYAASVYDANQNASILWYHPLNRRIEQGSLKEAMNAWAWYLGIAHQIETDATGHSGSVWQVIPKPHQKPLPLWAVGVGVSQVLPVLVMGLLAPKNTLLIIEHPELHLHPRAQARLGDFFIGLSQCQKQCLIETHSENLVSQLRYHIVQSGGQEQSDCIIYFVDQDEKGASRFEQVEISPQGNILNWPDGFFDETMRQEDSITAESIKRRAGSVKNG